jgi:hypothetical protein
VVGLVRRHEVLTVLLEGGGEGAEIGCQVCLGDIEECDGLQAVAGGEVVSGESPRVEGSRCEARDAALAIQEGAVAQQGLRGAVLGRDGQRELGVGEEVVVGGRTVEPTDDVADIEVADCEDDLVLLVVDSASFDTDLATSSEEGVVHRGSVGDLHYDRLLRHHGETIDFVTELGFEVEEWGALFGAGAQAVAQVVALLLAQESAWALVTRHCV